MMENVVKNKNKYDKLVRNVIMTSYNPKPLEFESAEDSLIDDSVYAQDVDENNIAKKVVKWHDVRKEDKDAMY